MLSRAEYAALSEAARFDPRPLIETFQITTKGNPGQKPVEPFKFYDYQARIHEKILESRRQGIPPRIICLKGRQAGESTHGSSYVTAESFAVPYSNSLIVGHVQDSAEILFEKVLFAYDRMDPDLKPRIKPPSKTRLQVEEMICRDGIVPIKSSVTVGTAGGQEIWRGLTLKVVHLAEFAKYLDPQAVLAGVLPAVPSNIDTLVFIESTAQGMGNLFHQMWLDAEAGKNGFIPVFIPWFELPDSHVGAKAPPDFTRDAEEERLRTTYGCTDNQLQWRRYMIATYCGGDINIWNQEYPESPEVAFLSTGLPAFPQEQLHEQKQAARGLEIQQGVLSAKDGEYKMVPYRMGPLSVWKPPIAGHDYTIGIDVSAGVQGRDYSSCQVFDRDAMEQVAHWHGYVSPTELGHIALGLGLWYNTAILAPEITGGHGLSVLEVLKREFYTRFYVFQRIDKVRNTLTPFLGWETSFRTRGLMIDSMRHALLERAIRLFDLTTIDELIEFSYVNATRAEGIGHDDAAMAMMIAYRCHLEMPLPATGLPPLHQGIPEEQPPADPYQALGGNLNQEAWRETDRSVKELSHGGRSLWREIDIPQGDEEEEGTENPLLSFPW